MRYIIKIDYSNIKETDFKNKLNGFLKKYNGCFHEKEEKIILPSSENLKKKDLEKELSPIKITLLCKLT